MKRFLKLLYFRIKSYTKKVTIRNGCNIGFHSEFEGCNAIGKNSSFSGRLGFGSYIGENSTILGRVGKFCSIASDVKVISGTHPLSDYVSTSPVFYSVLKQSNVTYAKEQLFDEVLYADPENSHAVIIGNDVWIGTGASILAGLTIGDGAVILANATVTRDVPPYAIVGGVPAKMVRKRFDNEMIDFLLTFKWWNKPTDWIESNASYFLDINRFLEAFRNQQINS